MRKSGPLRCADSDVHETLECVGDRWTIYVVRTLSERPMRFNQLKRMISGISSRMLAVTLRKLERDGMVSRDATARGASYLLTPLGVSFLQPVVALMRWADQHKSDVHAARRTYDNSYIDDYNHSTRPMKETPYPENVDGDLAQSRNELEHAQASVDAPVQQRMIISSASPKVVAPKPPPEKAASATVLAALTSSSGSSAAKEATETPAQTAQEAAHGDQQAVRLQAARAHKAESPSPPGTARLVKVTA